MADQGSVTALLLAWGKGDEVAFQHLVPLVERELHRIAKRCMAGERAGHSLEATALVNEAYLRLIDAQQVKWQDRAHFLAMSARLMRRILVDWARSKQYQKRGGGAMKVTLTRLCRSPPKGDKTSLHWTRHSRRSQSSTNARAR